jgi:hypothetical protein
MSYLTFPRLHFSGQFKAYPSTINNYPDNYDPSVYPSPNELVGVALGWGPKGDGGFDFIDCVITQIDYADGTSATSVRQDPIIGQPVAAIPNSSFQLAATLVDLDPEQQQVSEIWGMSLQIGGKNAYLKGDFSPAAFNSIWGNVQGPNAPQSSASAGANYQGVLKNLETNGLTGKSKFLGYFAENPAAALSINFVVNAHNNNPPIYAFNVDTFKELALAGVSASVLRKIKPMQQLVQNLGQTEGNVPTKDFVTFQLQQYLSTNEYNASIDAILKVTEMPYTGYTPYDFTCGFTAGTIGINSATAPDYFVPSRMMAVQDIGPNFSSSLPVNFTPFDISAKDNRISINFNNSLAVKDAGGSFYKQKLGELWLVAFPKGNISLPNAEKIVQIPYTKAGFLNKSGGVFTDKLTKDYSKTPLGIISYNSGKLSQSDCILLAENKSGYYLRANQFVFRMNPGVKSTRENPRGETATVDIHVLKFGRPVKDGTPIIMTDNQRRNQGLATPSTALKVSPGRGGSKTKNGVARFKLTASDPGNPRGYINGQLYFKNYGFFDQNIDASYIPNPTDFISIQVYNQLVEEEAIDILNKYGRLYKIMGFLDNDKLVSSIDMRNMIKLLLNKPMASLEHMPVTRDLSIADREKITAWIDQLNNS